MTCDEFTETPVECCYHLVTTCLYYYLLQMETNNHMDEQTLRDILSQIEDGDSVGA